MLRRLLLFAIFAATPVAETRAEFLFSSPEAAEDTRIVAGAASDDRNDPPPTDKTKHGGFKEKPSGLDSAGSPPAAGFAGALRTSAVRIADGGFLSYLVGERGHRYQRPHLPGLLRPPQGAC